MYIDNFADGTISGGIAAIRVTGTGSFALGNAGVIAGKIALTESSMYDGDSILNTGEIRGTVSLGAGDDVFRNENGGISGAVYGGAGMDQLFGGNRKDVLKGGANSDQLSGGWGNDTLTGGAGHDKFVFEDSLLHIGIDKITDFVHGTDQVTLSKSYFGEFSTA